MYEKIKRIGILFLASLLITALLVPFPTSAQAQRPEWEEGDSWAMGSEGDIKEIFKPTLDMIDEEIEREIDEEEDLYEMDYDIDGEVGFYQIYEIIEANDDGYVMQIEAGGGIQVSGSFEATGEMEEEGTHDRDDYWDDNIPTETKTISAEADIFFMLDIEGTVHFNEDLAIEEIELEYELEFSVEFSAENFPSYDHDWQNETVTIEYEDFSGGMSAEVILQIQMEFEPALDLFNFPIEENTDWEAESQMTIWGSYEGVIDIDDEEMPDEFQEMIKEIEEELEQEFPIILEEIDTEEDEVNFGEIEETTEHVKIPMRCTGTDEVVLYDGRRTDVYVLEFGPDDDFFPAEVGAQQIGPSMRMLFSEEEGFIVSQQMNLGPEMGGMIGMQSMEMRSMDVEEAREGKQEIQEEKEDGFLDLLISPPILYVLVGVIVIILVVAVLLGRGGKKRETPDRNVNQNYGEERSEFQQESQEPEWPQEEEPR